MMAARLKSLRRIEAVQAEMTRLAEWRLAAAERACRAAAEDKARLDAFVGDEVAVGAPLARAALRTSKGIERRLASAEAERALERDRLDALRRRDGALEAAVSRAAVAARREAEARELGEVIEAWLAGGRD